MYLDYSSTPHYEQTTMYPRHPQQNTYNVGPYSYSQGNYNPTDYNSSFVFGPNTNESSSSAGPTAQSGGGVAGVAASGYGSHAMGSTYTSLTPVTSEWPAVSGQTSAFHNSPAGQLPTSSTSTVGTLSYGSPFYDYQLHHQDLSGTIPGIKSEVAGAQILPGGGVNPRQSGSGYPRPELEWIKNQRPTAAPSSGKTRTKDKYRVVYSDHQRLELEKEFHYSRYITIRRKAELANQLGLSERQVKIWFQNRRAKERKTNKKKQQDQTGKESPEGAQSTTNSIKVESDKDTK